MYHVNSKNASIHSLRLRRFHVHLLNRCLEIQIVSFATSTYFLKMIDSKLDLLNIYVLLIFMLQAALAGLMGEMIYSPYDITGAKFLWWTWHDTDAPVRDRLFGAPIGSSTWVITFCCSFHFIWRKILSDNQIFFNQVRILQPFFVI